MVVRQVHHHPEQATRERGARRRMEIILKDLQKKVRLNSPQIIKIIKMILRHEGVDNAVLSIVFVNHQRMKALNKKYLNRNHTTDVLAFDLKDDVALKRRPKTVMGDIIISTDAALKHVSAHQTVLAEELTLYVIHGILHLCGYDDHKANDIRKMRKKEQELLSYLSTKVNTVLVGN